MLRLNSFRSIENFGDNLNDFIIGSLISPEIQHVDSSVERDYLMLIGSLLHEATTHAVVWGSGIISPQHLPKSMPRQIACVRGPLSRQVLVENGFLDPDREIPLGDPAFLLHAIDGITAPAPKEFDIGFIPHYADHLLFNQFSARAPKRYFAHDWINAHLFSGDPIRHLEFGNTTAITIDVRRNCTEVINDMKRCRYIASSSLHGLIVADVLNIPNTWIRFGDNLTGGAFKFIDYMLTVGRLDMEPYLIRERIRDRHINHILQRTESWHFTFDFDTYLRNFRLFLDAYRPLFMD